jgi:hypothetical protein
MGAWSADSFGNDRAGDWACELSEADDLAFVEQTLDDVFATGAAYLDSDEACAGLAACEVLARLKGQWGKRDADSRRVDDWVESHPQIVPERLIAKAIEVIDRITREPSELLELWAESDKSKEPRQNNLPNSLINDEGGFHSSIHHDIGAV